MADVLYVALIAVGFALLTATMRRRGLCAVRELPRDGVHE